MFLRNYDNLLAAIQLGQTSYMNASNSKDSSGITSNGYQINGTSEFGEGYANAKAANGVICRFCSGYPSSSSAAYIYPPLIFTAKLIGLGSGTAEVDYDDYKLANMITNKLTETSNTISYNEEAGSWRRTIVASYANSGNSDITISEWGLFRSQDPYNKYGPPDNSIYYVLMYREVLAEPIVIAAGTTAELTFSIEIPMPNHP